VWFGHDTGRHGGIESASAGLKRTHPELLVSKQKLRQAEGSCIVRKKPRGREAERGLVRDLLSFAGCRCVSRPPAKCSMSERRNGDFVLQITGHPNYGLPFGQDRIVPFSEFR
jgi:hypothetical protein